MVRRDWCPVWHCSMAGWELVRTEWFVEHGFGEGEEEDHRGEGATTTRFIN